MVLITASVNFQVHVREEGRARGGGGEGYGMGKWRMFKCSTHLGERYFLLVHRYKENRQMNLFMLNIIRNKLQVQEFYKL